MPYLQTPDEMADELADLFGIYGSHDERCGYWTHESTAAPIDLKAFIDAKPCRMCWNGIMENRIRATVKNEQRLAT